MTDTLACKIMLKPEARDFMLDLPARVKCALIDFIRAEAPHADTAMVVLSWTCDGDYEHIERAFKWYVTRPTMRILFHRTQDGITIDRIAYRCDDPYSQP